MEKRKILQMNKISKSFGGVEVLHAVDFDLEPGEVHVLIGENGAGKSTLMKILSGVEMMDSGEVLLENDEQQLCPVDIKDPKTAQALGISMVFQESNLIDNISIAENIYLGREPHKNGFLDWGKMYRDTQAQLDNVKSISGPKQLAEKLSVAEKQTVEIAKALSYNAKIIVFDEPTSSLSDKEVDILFALIRETKAKGIGIVYISHRLEEIFAIGDRITVFRDGSLIDTMAVKDTTPDGLVHKMIGRELEKDIEEPTALPEDTEVALSVRDVHVQGCETSVDFDVYKGEILGFFGLVGAGRTELARILFGVDPIGAGKLYKFGQEIRNSSPDVAIKNGFALLPEDRKRIGLVSKLPIRENLVLVKLRELSYILWNKNREKAITAEYMKKLSIVARGQEQLVSHLSGGNQQKVVYAKWLSMHPEIMILDEPTRGIDVAVKAEIYSLMRSLARQGVTILMISSDLPEILRVSNRVVVMHDHKITLVEKRENLDQQRIMEAAIQ